MNDFCLNNKMLSLVFHQVIKAPSVAEKKSKPALAPGYDASYYYYHFFFCNDGCLHYQRKHCCLYLHFIAFLKA
jgi:hypothetical protein